MRMREQTNRVVILIAIGLYTYISIYIRDELKK
jgi:hypothetical protein